MATPTNAVAHEDRKTEHRRSRHQFRIHPGGKFSLNNHPPQAAINTHTHAYVFLREYQIVSQTRISISVSNDKGLISSDTKSAVHLFDQLPHISKHCGDLAAVGDDFRAVATMPASIVIPERCAG